MNFLNLFTNNKIWIKVERCYLMLGTSERKKSWYYLNWSSDEEVLAAEDIFATTLVQQIRRSTWPSSTLYGTSKTCSSFAAKIESMCMSWRRTGMFKPDIRYSSPGVMLIEVSFFQTSKWMLQKIYLLQR